MKKIFLSFALAVIALTAAAQDDPIVMRINGVPVTRSEFEYNYNKNNSEGVIDKKNIEEYAELFVNYKLKVQAAKQSSIDTYVILVGLLMRGINGGYLAQRGVGIDHIVTAAERITTSGR